MTWTANSTTLMIARILSAFSMWQRIISDRRNRSISILVLLIVAAAIPLTVLLSQREQDIRQRAASSDEVCSITGTDTVLIIDKSNSMNWATSATDSTPRLVRAKQAAKNFVDLLAQQNSMLPADKKHKVSVVSFSNSALTTTDVALTSDLNLVKQKIDAIVPGDDLTGWTCIECGIKKANVQFTSGSQRTNLKNVAVLLTDGKANYLDGGTSQVEQALAEQKAMEAAMSAFYSSQTLYFTIGLGTPNEINETFLRTMATQTGASYYYSPTASDLNGIYTSISQVIGKGTVRGYVFHDLNKNGVYDSNEPRLSNWTITLRNQATSETKTLQTNANGEYSFTDVCDGTYLLSQTVLDGWQQHMPSDNAPYTITISNSNSQFDKFFANIPAVKPTTMSLTLFVHGIGNSGDNANPNNHALSNKNPHTTSREATVEVLTIFGTLMDTQKATLSYDSTAGNFKGSVELSDSIQTDNYLVKVRLPGTLRLQYPTAHRIIKEQTISLPPVHLVTGDVKSDNKLDILDYNIIVSCYSDYTAAIACTPELKTLADITDDGSVNQFDYNLFLRDLSVQNGD